MGSKRRRASGHIGEDSNGGLAGAGSGGSNSDGAFGAVRPVPKPEATVGLAHDLAVILGRDDGWLRVVPDHDTQVLWLKWKYTHGPWAGHYVMARVGDWAVAYGLSLLLDKLDAVDVGARRPTKDTAYDRGDSDEGT